MAEDRTLYPNTFQHHNWYVDELLYLLTPEESKVLTYALREIMGWEAGRQTRRARIALSCFVEGWKDRQGTIRSHGTGMNRAVVKRALKELCRFGLLTRHDTTRSGTEYELNLDTALIDLKGLKARRAHRLERIRLRTQHAVTAMHQKRGIMDKPPKGLCHNPIRGLCHNPIKLINSKPTMRAKARKEKSLKEKPMPERHVSLDHVFDEDKPKKQTFPPRTPWAKYLEENARFGRNQTKWHGFETAGQRKEWERLEDEHSKDIRGTIDWAIRKGFTQSTIASRIIAALNKKATSAPAETWDSLETVRAEE